MKLSETISLVLYLGLFIGWYLTFADSMAYSLAQSRAKSKVQSKLKKDSKKKKDTHPLKEYIEDMMAIVEGKRKQGAIIKFYETSIALALFGIAVAYILLTPKVAPITGIVGLLSPFIYYKSKLEEIRNEASQEGEILATELLNNYKVSYYNILEAIRNTAETISAEEAPYSKKMLLQLAYDFNTVSNKEEASKAVERFKFGIDTTWAALLATNIELAHTEGVLITSSMEDLVDSIIKARKTKEELKRQGSEGRKMLKVLVPVIYITTALFGSMAFDMSMHQFFYNQFKTDMGSTWFVVVSVTYLMSLLFTNIISKEKMDI